MQHTIKTYYEDIKNRPWNAPITATYGGSGAFGSAVDNFHDLAPNCSKLSDYWGVELKSHDVSQEQSLVSLGGKNPNYRFENGEWIKARGLNSKIWHRFGYHCPIEDKKRLYMTLAMGKAFSPALPSVETGSRHVFEIVQKNDFYALTVDGDTVGGWKRSELEAQFKIKFGNILAYYKGSPLFTKKTFEITDMTLHWGMKSFATLFEEGTITTDIRISSKFNKRGFMIARDHGTVSRIKDVDKLYNNGVTIIDSKQWNRL